MGSSADTDAPSGTEAETDLVEYRRHVAVHEAGHAVIGLVLGLEVVGILLEMTNNGGGGYTIFSDGFTRDPVELMQRHPQLMGPTLLAGACAEQELLKGRVVSGGWEVDTDIFSIGHPNPGSDVTAITEMIAATRARAEELVKQYREAINEVATRLMTVDHLMGDDLAIPL